MTKQLGWISVAAISLAALSACAEQDKPAPATEATTAAPNALETIHVDPVATKRLQTMYGKDLAVVLGGPTIEGTQPETKSLSANAPDESTLKIAAHKSGEAIETIAPNVPKKTSTIGGVK